MTLLIGVTDDLESCLELRRAVFVREQNVPEDLEVDGRDAEAIHMLARRDGVAVGCARILVEGPVGKIGRVCVLAPHRGTGLGQALTLTCLEVLRSRKGVREARLGAQLHALEFYRRFGFEAEGPIYDDAGIPHREMSMAL